MYNLISFAVVVETRWGQGCRRAFVAIELSCKTVLNEF